MDSTPVLPYRASLDELIYTLAVNFLMYVVLIVVFYMLTRFYLEEQTSYTASEFMNMNGYALVSTEDNLDIELASTAIEEEEEKPRNNVSISEPSISTSNLNVNILGSPRKYITSMLEGKESEDSDRNDLISKIIFCGVGLNITFGIWGLLQERILTQTYGNDFFEYSYGLVFINRLLACLFSAYLMYYFRITWIQSPLWEYSIPSVANMLSSWCQYEALKYVSFPTQMLAKAFKMLPVMLVGKLIHNKSYETYEYVSAAAVGFGIYLFIESSEHIDFQQNVFGDPASVSDGWCGVVLLLLFLCFDSFTGQWQTRMFQIYSEMSPLQMMLISNGFSCLFSFITLVHQEELDKSLSFVYNHPEMYWHLILFCICSTVGQLFIYYTVKSFGAVVFSIIMATRILLSTLLSCFFYSHPITELGFIGFLVVFGSIAYRIQQKTEGKPLIRMNKSSESKREVTKEWREQVDV